MTISERTAWELETGLTPDEVLGALVDFGPRRSRIWMESSHPKVYWVHEVGATWADVTEGVTGSWSREHYDWSVPGTITLTQMDSNVAVPGGTIRYTLTPIATGTRIACDRRRLYRTTFDGLLAGTLMRLVGRQILRWQFARGLGRAADLIAPRET